MPGWDARPTTYYSSPARIACTGMNFYLRPSYRLGSACAFLSSVVRGHFGGQRLDCFQSARCGRRQVRRCVPPLRLRRRREPRAIRAAVPRTAPSDPKGIWSTIAPAAPATARPGFPSRAAKLCLLQHRAQAPAVLNRAPGPLVHDRAKAREQLQFEELRIRQAQGLRQCAHRLRPGSCRPLATRSYPRRPPDDGRHKTAWSPGRSARQLSRSGWSGYRHSGFPIESARWAARSASRRRAWSLSLAARSSSREWI